MGGGRGTALTSVPTTNPCCGESPILGKIFCVGDRHVLIGDSWDRSPGISSINNQTLKKGVPRRVQGGPKTSYKWDEMRPL